MRCEVQPCDSWPAAPALSSPPPRNLENYSSVSSPPHLTSSPISAWLLPLSCLFTSYLIYQPLESLRVPLPPILGRALQYTVLKMNGAGPTEEIDLYAILGVEKDAAQADIRKAYRKAALAHHPDKVAPEEREEAEVRFKAASQAYEILYDDEKRHLYDAHGMAAFDGSRGPGGMGGEVNMEDILNMFGMGGGIPGMGGMGGMGGMPGGGPRKMRRSPDENQKYEVTLEDLYKGKTVKFSSTKNAICSKCSGTGGADKAKPKECSTCKGQGVKQVLSQVGPGMLTQRMVECSACEGTGQVFNPKDKCKKCKGKRTVEERKQLELYIPRGAREGDQIRLEGEADQIPGAEQTGDIVFHLVEQPHEVFQRTGNDLSAKLRFPWRRL